MVRRDMLVLHLGYQKHDKFLKRVLVDMYAEYAKRADKLSSDQYICTYYL